MESHKIPWFQTTNQQVLKANFQKVLASLKAPAQGSQPYFVPCFSVNLFRRTTTKRIVDDLPPRNLASLSQIWKNFDDRNQLSCSPSAIFSAMIPRVLKFLQLEKG